MHPRSKRHARTHLHAPHTHSTKTQLTRKTIDVLKEYFRDEMSKEDWKLIMRMKKIFNVL